MTPAGRRLAIKSCNYMPAWIFEYEFIRYLFILYFYLALPSFHVLQDIPPMILFALMMA